MKKFSLLFLLLFLSGCSNGLSAQTYNGSSLDERPDDIRDYREENIVRTEGLSERYPFTESKEVTGKSGASGTAVTLEPGVYTVGEEIEPGEYDIDAADIPAAALVLTDNSGVIIMELSVSFDVNTAVVDLKDGYTVEFKARSDEMTLTPSEERDYDGERIYLPAGMTEAGSDIPAGDYHLMSPALPVMHPSGESKIYVNYNYMNPEHSDINDISDLSEFPLVTIKEGDMIVSEQEILLVKE